MSRHGYQDDLDQQQLAMWRGWVASAIRGKRGQKLLRDFRDALDAMPEKVLIARDLQTEEGCCSLGLVGRHRGLDFSKLDPEQDNDVLSDQLNIAECLVREVEYLNDDYGPADETPQQRWQRMRDWVEKQIEPAEVKP